MRLTRVHPAGAMMVALGGLTPIEAISTSFAAAPAGSPMKSPLAAGRNARIWVLPTPACCDALAVLTPVEPGAAWRIQFASMAWPAEVGVAGVAISNPSVMPEGGFQLAAEEKVCEVTSMVFATVVLTLGVGWLSECDVVRPFSTLIGLAASTPEKLWIPPTAW